MPCLNARTVSAHLADVSTEVAEGAHAVLVLDGAGFHIAKDLAIPRNITPMRLPAYSPELNPIENVWEYLRGNQLSNTVCETCDEIVTACCNAWNFFADDPQRIATITTRSWAIIY
jgi:transposase